MSEKRTHQLSKLPVFFELSGRTALVAGDERAVMPKARLLAMAGAQVRISAPNMRGDFEDLLAGFKPAHKITLAERPWRKQDLLNAVLAIGAFSGLESATRFCQAAREAGVPVNLVDRPALCDFQIPVIVNRSPLVVGISTSGAAPVIGQWLRGRLESLLPQGTGAVLEAASACRARVNAKLKTSASRRAFWRKLAEQDLALLARAKTTSEIEAALLARLESADAEAFDKGRVLLIGVPDLPEDMPLKTLALLQNADIVVRSKDVNPDYLDFIRRDARQIEPGTPCDSMQYIILQAQQDQNVIWLHGKTTKQNTLDIARILSEAGIESQIL